MGYFWRWLLLLGFLFLESNKIKAQTNTDTLKMCIEQITDSLKKPIRSLIVGTPKGSENPNNRQWLRIEYELAQKTYNQGKQDVWVQFCINNQLMTEADSSVCGDLGRIKGRSGKLQIDFNRLVTGEPDSETTELFARSLEEEKPPVSKWVLNSLFRPNWGHQQIRDFNQPEEKKQLEVPQIEKEQEVDIEVEVEGVRGLKEKNSKKEDEREKKGKITYVIGGLLVVGALTKLTSMGNYETAKRYYGRGNTTEGKFYYDKANQQHKFFLGFTGFAIGVNLANAFSVLNKGNREMKKYRRKYPKNRGCGNQ